MKKAVIRMLLVLGCIVNTLGQEREEINIEQNKNITNRLTELQNQTTNDVQKEEIKIFQTKHEIGQLVEQNLEFLSTTMDITVKKEGDYPLAFTYISFPKENVMITIIYTNKVFTTGRSAYGIKGDIPYRYYINNIDSECNKTSHDNFLEIIKDKINKKTK